MKIVFLGDSITEGCFEIIEKADGGFDGVTDSPSGYVSLTEGRLKERFPGMDIDVINAGIGGNTSGDGLARLQKDVISHKPDIAVVCFGLNDMGLSLEEYKNNLCEIFRQLKAAEVKTVFMTPNMTNTEKYDFSSEILSSVARGCAKSQTDGTMDSYMDTARSSAESYGVAVCDAYALWKKLSSYGIKTDELLSNHINHPTRAMHRLFADLLEPVLAGLICELSESK